MRGHGPTPAGHSRPFLTIVVAIDTYSNGSGAASRPAIASTAGLYQGVLSSILLMIRVVFVQCRGRNDRNPLGISAIQYVHTSFRYRTTYYVPHKLNYIVILDTLFLLA